jgi:hypothetical protein
MVEPLLLDQPDLGKPFGEAADRPGLINGFLLTHSFLLGYRSL